MNENLPKTKVESKDVKVAQNNASLSLAFVLIYYSISMASAAPTGGAITGGTGDINQAGLITTIKQDTSSLAIDWQGFDVKANEVVNYLQPGTSSIALNRILSNNPSQIDGQINANKRISLLT